jgi:hypothetical protein
LPKVYIFSGLTNVIPVRNREFSKNPEFTKKRAYFWPNNFKRNSESYTKVKKMAEQEDNKESERLTIDQWISKMPEPMKSEVNMCIIGGINEQIKYIEKDADSFLARQSPTAETIENVVNVFSKRIEKMVYVLSIEHKQHNPRAVEFYTRQNIENLLGIGGPYYWTAKNPMGKAYILAIGSKLKNYDDTLADDANGLAALALGALAEKTNLYDPVSVCAAILDYSEINFPERKFGIRSVQNTADYASHIYMIATGVLSEEPIINNLDKDIKEEWAARVGGVLSKINKRFYQELKQCATQAFEIPEEKFEGYKKLYQQKTKTIAN